MSMTPKEALKILTGAEIMVLNRFHDKFMDAACVALNCLKEKAEQEDPKPLTIEELQQMNGEPVWLEDEKVWGIINIDDCGQWKDKPFITFYWRTIRCDWNIESRGLTCYRHKPKEDAK